jgi:hypothetical protein
MQVLRIFSVKCLEDMMKHKKIEKLMVLYLDGILEKSESEKIHDHLQQCAKCRSKFSDLEKIWNIQSEPLSAPGDQWYKIMAKMNSQKTGSVHPVRNFVMLFRSVAYISIILATIFLGNMIGRTQSQNSHIKQEKSHTHFLRDFNLDKLDPVSPELIGNVSFLPADKEADKK